MGYVDLVAVGSGKDIQFSLVFVAKGAPKCLKTFEECEKTGTNISFRCMDCRNCKECLKGGLIEEISIQEEYEQDLINKSVSVDIESGECSASLPFLSDPDLKLPNTRALAKKVYEAQLRVLAKSYKDRLDSIEAEKKLQDLEFIDFLDDLSEDEKN